jgi:ribose 5-phosphate isomerase B
MMELECCIKVIRDTGEAKMNIAVGSDHGGFELKEEIVNYLKGKGVNVTDFGTHSGSSVDYPVYGEKVAEAVVSGAADLGIVVCGTGQGIAMAANKVKGIRAAVVADTYSAEMTRLHNNANILSLGGRVVGPGLALKIVETFISTPFEGGRHERRVDLLTSIEAKYSK